MQPNLPSEHTREAMPSTLRSIFGFDIPFNAGEIIPLLDKERDAKIAADDLQRTRELIDCETYEERQAVQRRHRTNVNDIRTAHVRSIESVQQWDRQRANQAAEGGRLL